MGRRRDHWLDQALNDWANQVTIGGLSGYGWPPETPIYRLIRGDAGGYGFGSKPPGRIASVPEHVLQIDRAMALLKKTPAGRKHFDVLEKHYVMRVNEEKSRRWFESINAAINALEMIVQMQDAIIAEGA